MVSTLNALDAIPQYEWVDIGTIIRESSQAHEMAFHGGVAARQMKGRK